MMKTMEKIIIKILLALSICLSLQTRIAFSSSENINLSATDQTLISAISNAITQDSTLKHTYSYQTCMLIKVLGESAWDYSTLGPLGIISSASKWIGAHYAPQFLYSVGKAILPGRWYSRYEKIIGASSLAFHGYSMLLNPVKQVTGYATGSLSVFLTRKFLNKIDYFSIRNQREIEGAAYFLAKEIGWNLHDNYRQDVKDYFNNLTTSILSFLKEIPADQRIFQSYKSVNETLTIKEELQPAPSGLELVFTNSSTLEKNLTSSKFESTFVKAATIDDEIYTKLDLTPECRSWGFENEVKERFNQTTAFIIDAHIHAEKSGKKLGIIWGERHDSCSCYLQERQLFKLLHELGIQDFYMEGEPAEARDLIYQIQKLQRSFSKKTYIEPNKIWILPRYAHAMLTGLNITFAEEPQKSLDWYTHQYFEKLKDIAEGRSGWGKITEKAPKANQGKLLKKDLGAAINWIQELNALLLMTTCPDFLERDNHMIKKLKSAKNSFGSLFGAGHLGSIYRALTTSTQKDFEYIFLTCTQGEDIKTDLARSNTSIKGVNILELRELIGKVVSHSSDCLKEYDEAVKLHFFFRTSSPQQVYRSITTKDKLFEE